MPRNERIFFCARCNKKLRGNNGSRRIAPDTRLCNSCFAEEGREYGGLDRKRQIRYGLAPEEHGDLYKAQLGKCAICRERAPLYIDHDHVTGQVRGLLCHHCNAGLGFFRDSISYLAGAIQYLNP